MKNSDRKIVWVLVEKICFRNVFGNPAEATGRSQRALRPRVVGVRLGLSHSVESGDDGAGGLVVLEHFARLRFELRTKSIEQDVVLFW